jgi:hypothetical protein
MTIDMETIKAQALVSGLHREKKGSVKKTRKPLPKKQKRSSLREQLLFIDYSTPPENNLYSSCWFRKKSGITSHGTELQLKRYSGHVRAGRQPYLLFWK